MPDDRSDRGNSLAAEVIDKFLIIEQLTRYHHAVDFKQWDDLDAILTEDCTASWPGLGVVRGLPTDNPNGREAIKDWLKAAVGEGTSLHYMVNHVVEVDRDRAANRSMVAIGDEYSNLYHLGHYDGAHFRTPDGWRISALQFVVAPAAKRRPMRVEQKSFG